MSTTDYKLARIEQFLARLTPQSKGADPKLPPGGVPEFTYQDLQNMCWRMDLVTFWIITAKWCQSELSEANLVDAMTRLSRTLWDGPNIETNILNRIAEAAVIVFLNPRDPKGRLRKDPWISSYIEGGLHRKTFQRKYKRHYERLASVLDRRESAGLESIDRALRRSA